MGVIEYIRGSIYKLAISIVALYGAWISLVESMNINHDDEYALQGHFYAEEDAMAGSHESRFEEPEAAILAGTAGTLGLACCGGALLATSFG